MNSTPKRVEEVLALEEQVRRLTAEVASLKPKPTADRQVAGGSETPPRRYDFVGPLIVAVVTFGLIGVFVWFLCSMEDDPGGSPACWVVERVAKAKPWEPMFLLTEIRFSKTRRWSRPVEPYVEFKTAEEGAAFLQKYNLKCVR